MGRGWFCWRVVAWPFFSYLVSVSETPDAQSDHPNGHRGPTPSATPFPFRPSIPPYSLALLSMTHDQNRILHHFLFAPEKKDRTKVAVVYSLWNPELAISNQVQVTSLTVTSRVNHPIILQWLRWFDLRKPTTEMIKQLFTPSILLCIYACLAS